jgi:hypothetical protein
MVVNDSDVSGDTPCVKTTDERSPGLQVSVNAPSERRRFANLLVDEQRRLVGRRCESKRYRDA